MADVISVLAVTVQLSTYLQVLCGNHECLLSTMARRSRVSVEDILQHLNGDDSLEHGMDGSSDDDLGMDTDYEYELDSSLEGIHSYYNQQTIQNNNNNTIMLLL